MQEIISKIKTKQFKDIDDAVVKKELDLVLKKNQKLAKEIQGKVFNEKSAAVKQIIKLVKQSLHYSYTSFQKGTEKREKLLSELSKAKDKDELIELHTKLLETHASTKERIEIYETLYDDLFEITGKVTSILDLGCGLNPLSLPWMKLKNTTYIASEFNSADTKFIDQYFSLIKKNYSSCELKTVVIDLKTEVEKVKKIPVDVIFAWKVFDLLKTKEVEAVVKNCNSKYLIASFSTETLGKKKMNKPQRTWFEMMLKRLNHSYEIKEYENELFYIITL